MLKKETQHEKAIGDLKRLKYLVSYFINFILNGPSIELNELCHTVLLK
jgi:hypothetical protein